MDVEIRNLDVLIDNKKVLNDFNLSIKKGWFSILFLCAIK